MRYWNISRIKAFKICGELARQKWVLGRVGLGGEDKPEADFGTCIHAALKEYVDHENDLALALDAFHASMDGYPDIEDMRVMGRNLLSWYHRMYANDKRVIICTEKELMAPLDDRNVLVGRIDRLVCREAPYGYWHEQIKTVGYNRSLVDEASGYELDWHERGYAFLVKKNRKSLGLDERIPYMGTNLDLIRKQKRGAMRPSPVGPDNFHRAYVTFDEKSLERFQQDMLIEIARWENGEFTQNPASCMWQFGRRKCVFHELCLGWPIPAEDWGMREPDYVDKLNEEAMDAT